jgi:nitrous-oxide reductase
MSVYGIPSGRLLRVIPVFSVDPEKGYGFSEDTKSMLNTSHGFIPWDDLHHMPCLKRWHTRWPLGFRKWQ